mgnify:CR=1 FL=1
MNKQHSGGFVPHYLTVVFIMFFNQTVYSQISVESQLDQKAQLAKTLIFTNPAKGDLIADTIIKLSQKNKLFLLEATGWNIKGVIKAFTSSPDSALKYFTNSERLAIRANDKLALAKAIANKNIPLQEMGKYDQAISDFNKVLQIDPQFAQAYNNRSMANYRAKDYAKACADLRQFQQHGGVPQPEYAKELQATGKGQC